MGNNEIIMKLLVYILLLLSLISCDRSFQGQIEDKIQQTCNRNAACKIKMYEITGFEWDDMYVFSLGTTPEVINKAIGTFYMDWQDMSKFVIFTKSGKVVFHENYICNDPEKPCYQLINFIIPNDTITFKGYLSVKREDAIFDVKKINDDGDIYYLLSLSE